MTGQDIAQVLVSAIGAAGLVLSVTIPILLSTRKSARKAIAAGNAATEAGVAAREAVTNGHPEHIRDSLDRGFAELAQKVDAGHRELSEKVEGVRKELASDIRGMRRDVGRVGDRVDTLEGRVHDIEQKQPGVA